MERQILTHPFVIGEVACGSLPDRAEVLKSFELLPSAPVAGHAEVLHLLEQQRLWGRGVTWIDMHLLASALITGCRLWTLDQRLRGVARFLKVEV